METRIASAAAIEVDLGLAAIEDAASMISGVARWIKEHSPRTHIVGVCARGARRWR